MILSVDGTRIDDFTALQLALLDARPGQRMRLDVARGAQRSEREITLGARP